LAEEFSDFRTLALFLFTRSIPQRNMAACNESDMTSLHLIYTAHI